MTCHAERVTGRSPAPQQLCCAALAGCAAGGAPPGSPSAPSSAGPSPSAGNAPANAGKLTGNFCTDLKNIGTNMPIPASASGSLATMEQHDGRYLRQVAAYYRRLAAEAPPQAGQEIAVIASASRRLAGSITSGNTHSLSQIEQQMTSLASSGAAAAAFRKLVSYVTTKCA